MVGDHGTLRVLNLATDEVTAVDSGTTVNLHAVAGRGSLENPVITAVGEDLTIVLVDTSGARVERQTPGAGTFRGVHISSSGERLAVGERGGDGVIYRSRGGPYDVWGWDEVPDGTGPQHAVTAAPGGPAWSVGTRTGTGTQGTVLTPDGSDPWRIDSPGAHGVLRGAWAWADGALLVVGDKGQMFRRAGGTWKPEEVASQDSFRHLAAGFDPTFSSYGESWVTSESGLSRYRRWWAEFPVLGGAVAVVGDGLQPVAALTATHLYSHADGVWKVSGSSPPAPRTIESLVARAGGLWAADGEQLWFKPGDLAWQLEERTAGIKPHALGVSPDTGVLWLAGEDEEGNGALGWLGALNDATRVSFSEPIEPLRAVSVAWRSGACCEVWAVGDAGAVVSLWGQSVESPAQGPADVDFKGVFAESDSSVWIVGNRGRIFHVTNPSDATFPRNQASGLEEDITLWDVGRAQQGIMVVGDRGTVLVRQAEAP